MYFWLLSISVTRNKRRLIQSAGMRANSVIKIHRNGSLDRLAIFRPRQPLQSRPASTTPMTEHQQFLDDTRSRSPSPSPSVSQSIPLSPFKVPFPIVTKFKPFTLFGRKRAHSVSASVAPLFRQDEDKENDNNGENDRTTEKSNKINQQ